MTEPLVVGVGLLLALVGYDAVTRTLEAVEAPRVLPDDGTGTLASDLRKWAFAALVVGFVLVVEARPLSSIGIETMAPLPFVAWVAGGFAFTYGLGVVAYLGFRSAGLDVPDGFAAEQARRSVPARAFTAVSAGVTESVLYQGYPIERLAALTGSLPLAGGLAFLAFTAVHYAGDTFSLQETLFIGVPALSVTVLYVLSGNLLVVIAVHTLVDGVSLLTPGPEADDPAGTTTDPG